MNKIFKYGIPALLSTVALVSCDDWTETESIELKYPTIEEANPELYGKYLENLRAYKNRSHKQAYAWFRNSDTPDNRSTHVTVLPDSLDAVVILNPESVGRFRVCRACRRRARKKRPNFFTP